MNSFSTSEKVNLSSKEEGCDFSDLVKQVIGTALSDNKSCFQDFFNHIMLYCRDVSLLAASW